jgi:hypothetical protein
MKNLFTWLMIVATAVTLHSCRKGENDPFLSLRSRRARIAGEWKITYLASARSPALNYSFMSEIVTNTIFTDGTWTRIEKTMDGTNVISADTSSWQFIWTIKFEKDGTYTEIRKVNGGVKTREGTWDFVEDNPELKKKEAIRLTCNLFDGPTPFFIPIDGDVIPIDMLKNKKMVWKRAYGDGLETAMATDEIIFEQD